VSEHKTCHPLLLSTLSEEEREEHESCVSVGTFIAILQAKARTIVGQSGAA
jgi:hypothetical protein